MHSYTNREISCRVTLTLLLYVREENRGSLSGLLDGLELDEAYLMDPNNWVSHRFVQILYKRMIEILGDENAVYNMTIASERLQSLGILDRIVRLLGNPKFIYSQAPRYNKFLKLNGDVYIHELGDSWALLEDRYHDGFQKTRFDCDYTRGVLTGIPTMFGMPFARIEELECQVHHEHYGDRIWGDSPEYGKGRCLYRISWKKIGVPSILKRMFNRNRTNQLAINDLLEANSKIQEKYEEAKRLTYDLEKSNRMLVESKEELESKAAALKISEARYRLLAENATDVIWTYNLKSKGFDYISPSVKRNCGFSPEEAVELEPKDILEPGSLKEITDKIKEEQEKGPKDIDPHRTITLETPLICKDGERLWVESSISIIKDEHGNPEGILGVTRNISKRKETEDEKDRLAAALSHSQRMEAIGTLAGGIAHDFNNLLMGIQGRTSIILHDIDPSHPDYENLKEIEEYVSKAGGLTKQLLGFAREGKIEVRSIDMNQLIMTSAEMFGRTKKEVRIHTEFQTGIWAVEVDRGNIEQALLNLYVNAWHAMPRGGDLYLSTKNILIEEDEVESLNIPPRKYVKISVRDTGEGIDEDIIQRIFEPFFSTRERGRGTGLGLASSYGIIRNHGGVITVKSSKGNGAEFNIFLPAFDTKIPEQVKIAKEGPQNGNETVLLVDDEQIITDVGEKMLNKLGYSTIIAKSGSEAIAVYKAKQGNVDLVILDMIMPDMGGEETFGRLKSIDSESKILLASGYSMDGQAMDIMNRGCNGFIQKPFRIDDLSKKIREILDS